MGLFKIIKRNLIDKRVKSAKNAKLETIKHQGKIEKKMLENIFLSAINPAIQGGESRCKYNIIMGYIPSFVIERLVKMGYCVETHMDVFDQNKVVAITIKW